jgi:hypothetical protein
MGSILGVSIIRIYSESADIYLQKIKFRPKAYTFKIKNLENLSLFKNPPNRNAILPQGPFFSYRPNSSTGKKNLKILKAPVKYCLYWYRDVQYS